MQQKGGVWSRPRGHWLQVQCGGSAGCILGGNVAEKIEKEEGRGTGPLVSLFLLSFVSLGLT